MNTEVATVSLGHVNDKHTMTVMRSRFGSAVFFVEEPAVLDEYDTPTVRRIEPTLERALRDIPVTDRKALDAAVSDALATLGLG